MKSAQKVVILGSTGSVGKSTVDVLLKDKNKFKVNLLAAHSNHELLERQAKQLHCATSYLHDQASRKKVRGLRLLNQGSLLGFLATQNFDICVFAITDFELSTKALETILKRTDRSIRVALASKETVVVFGRYFRRLAAKNGHTILPLDSEPSAIFQCLGSLGGDGKLEKIYLTATGGPFYRNDLDHRKVTPALALAHPIWKMGPKITIDSATLMNKAFELMEICNLFDVRADDVQILVHPQCVIHSMVAMKNGTILAQLGPADMRLPIHFALHWPDGFSQDTASRHLLVEEMNTLTFEKPDFKRFPCLKIALEVATLSDREGGLLARAALVGVDEALVGKFINGKINFADMPKILKKVTREARRRIKRLNLQNTLVGAMSMYNWAKEVAL